jgi:alkanesulfonate monooxygenase SsuD/methylene tetrahydromethanopterin reductase-like flavin-dependent oxidoreductase (luciferase family)
VRLAEDAAVLHEMSGGRMILGVGLGYRPEEFAALGVPYAERGSRLTETLAIICRLWREERVSFDGAHFTLNNVTIYPRLPDPPPLWVGGWSTAAVRRAARYGDAWFPGPTADLAKVAQSLSGYDSALEETDRKRADLPIFREVFVADSPELLEAGLGPMLALYQSDYQSWGHSNVAGSADIAANRFIVGDAHTVAAGIAELRDKLGVTHLIARLHCHGVEESAVERSMRLLAEQVRPLVDAAGHRREEP